MTNSTGLLMADLRSRSPWAGPGTLEAAACDIERHVADEGALRRDRELRRGAGLSR